MNEEEKKAIDELIMLKHFLETEERYEGQEREVNAIEIVLGNLEALCDMQRTADIELENTRKINEEHQKENGLLRERIKALEDIIEDYQRIYCRSINDSIPKQKIKDKIEELTNTKGDFATYIAISERIKVLQELLQEENK